MNDEGTSTEDDDEEEDNSGGMPLEFESSSVMFVASTTVAATEPSDE